MNLSAFDLFLQMTTNRHKLRVGTSCLACLHCLAVLDGRVPRGEREGERGAGQLAAERRLPVRAEGLPQVQGQDHRRPHVLRARRHQASLEEAHVNT